MKIKYSLRRTINTGNYENIVIEYGEEIEASFITYEERDSARKKLVDSVESFLEKKEEEVRSQLGSGDKK